MLFLDYLIIIRLYVYFSFVNLMFQLNKRYQECIGPGDVKGHCKHLTFCPVDVLEGNKNVVEYLCVIDKT